MSVTINNQIAFFDWQLNELDQQWAKYHNAQVLDLYNANTLYVGRIWGYDEKRGVLIIRFKEGKFPRLKEPLTISYPKAIVGPMNNWVFSYGEYRAKYVEQYSNCKPIYFLENKENEEFRYIGFKDISIDFINHIRNDLNNKNHSIVIFGAEDPPRDYLVALKHFTTKNPLNSILNYSGDDIEKWKPKSLNQDASIISDVCHVINNKNITIIQGPPGTGKTHLTAEICSYYMSKNLRVCITSLTHKALMEAVVKEGLKQACEKNRVYKTNLSADEAMLVKGLENHDVKVPISPGHLLLTTYYSLSRLLMDNTHQHFDLLIIEEASQAFLTTIAGFSCLAKKIVVVGDFMQLQPIVLEEKKALNIDLNIYTLIFGLRTFSINNPDDSYRLVNTYRLTEKAALQTGIFYQNSLISRSNSEGLIIEGKYKDWFCSEGGTSLVYFKNLDEGKVPRNAISQVVELVSDTRKFYPDIEIAVLCAFKDTVNAVSDSMLRVKIKMNNIEVNTVDRVQGMTVDLCIYLIPSYQNKFSYNVNRFNVATSRAKRGTIILAENVVTDFILLPGPIIEYLNKSKKLFVE
jgi:DNA replication ATP-dependent helicase Dna2